MDRESHLKIAFATLGCKVNQNDAACLAAELSSRGHRIVSLRDSADVTVIYTLHRHSEDRLPSASSSGGRRLKTRAPASS